ncbi:MAG: TetR family transcriptional regulator [Heteroscytonema crispum UTEX LB 1556]
MTTSKRTTRQAKTKRSSTTRDPEVTKAQILDAAEEEFATAGLAGARTEAIASQTGVTKAMIYYYFQSKEELYKAVLERAYAEHFRSIQQMDVEHLPPQQALESIISQFLQQMSKNLNLASILFLEAIQNKGKYYPKQTGELIYGTLSRILSRGIAEGVFRPLEPRHTAVNIVGTCVFYFSAHENIKFLWSGKRMLSKEMLEQHTQEAIALILAGVHLN